MRAVKPYVFSGILLVSSGVLLSFYPFGDTPHIDRIMKVTLRDVGNKLLIGHGDSTTLIPPVRKTDEFAFELSFSKKLAIDPDGLVPIINESFESARLPKDYIVEVINCRDDEVAYSFQMDQNPEYNVIPCVGRELPKDCYRISVLLTEKSSMAKVKNSIPVLTLVLIGAFGIVLITRPKSRGRSTGRRVPRFTNIGRYTFYPQENKLTIGDKVLELSPKECELICLFSEHPNQLLKREYLMKQVWEDKGVFVGRSLDTFISKIRKKLRHDDSIQIVSVHGVGYKLQVFNWQGSRKRAN